MFGLLATIILATATLTAAQDTPPDEPPPAGRVGIQVVNVNGPGCLRETAVAAVSPDKTAFTVTYSDYLAQVGVGAKPGDRRKTCQLAVVVQVPQGYTYGVQRADYRGFAHLEAGAGAVQRAKYHFQGTMPTKFVAHRLTGPHSDNWQHTDVIPVAQVVHKPCGSQRNFNIHTELEVDSGTSDPRSTTSLVAMDSTDGDLSSTYHFVWKVCPARR